ncbi:DUF6420 family protein [Streptomyces sp. ISL-36]|uniref:DUF6420 family protein n=1 Tax=Streptomyces sp. ISL-36 TaxID=2819182 RepID=UPI002034B068
MGGDLRSFEVRTGSIPLTAFVRAALAVELGDFTLADRLLEETEARFGLLQKPRCRPGCRASGGAQRQGLPDRSVCGSGRAGAASVGGWSGATAAAGSARACVVTPRVPIASTGRPKAKVSRSRQGSGEGRACRGAGRNPGSSMPHHRPVTAACESSPVCSSGPWLAPGKITSGRRARLGPSVRASQAGVGSRLQ